MPPATFSSGALDIFSSTAHSVAKMISLNNQNLLTKLHITHQSPSVVIKKNVWVLILGKLGSRIFGVFFTSTTSYTNDFLLSFNTMLCSTFHILDSTSMPSLGHRLYMCVCMVNGLNMAVKEMSIGPSHFRLVYISQQYLARFSHNARRGEYTDIVAIGLDHPGYSIGVLKINICQIRTKI